MVDDREKEQTCLMIKLWTKTKQQENNYFPLEFGFYFLYWSDDVFFSYFTIILIHFTIINNHFYVFIENFIITNSLTLNICSVLFFFRKYVSSVIEYCLSDEICELISGAQSKIFLFSLEQICSNWVPNINRSQEREKHQKSYIGQENLFFPF